MKKHIKSGIFQIDQSGKIEHTSKLTIVALANGKKKSIKISATEKQKLLAALKELEYPKTNYIYKFFATLIFILIKDEKIDTLEVDREYYGHESVIKDMLISLHSRYNLKMPDVTFLLIGKKSNSHKLALGTFQTKLKPTIIVQAEYVLEVFYAKEKGRRLHSGRNNP